MADAITSARVGIGEPADAGAAALRELTPRLRALTSAELIRDPKLDPTAAATVVAASAKKVRPLRAELVAVFGPSAGERIDRLPTIARAVRQADIAVAAAGRQDLSSDHRQLRAEYDLLLWDARAMVLRGLLPAYELDKAKDLQGYDRAVRSTLILVAVLRRYWEKVKDRTPLTEADLERASACAHRLQDLKAERDRGLTRADEKELRMRALSLLVREYRELTRQVRYLRYWERDADTFVPSLWSRRGRRVRGETSAAPSHDEVADGRVRAESSSAPSRDELADGRAGPADADELRDGTRTLDSAEAVVADPPGSARPRPEGRRTASRPTAGTGTIQRTSAPMRARRPRRALGGDPRKRRRRA
ncbi:MAG: hypothetical protein AB7P00_41745, partial [Sandaracinaceae bacterium]